MADHVALRSRDPSTQVGAVLVRPDRTIAAVGYNGFPRNCLDFDELYADRDTKLMRTVHAEVNAILSAGGPVRGCTLYVSPLHPCAHCAGIIIQAGIVRVVARMASEIPAAWVKSFDAAKRLFLEANVTTRIIHV